MKQATAQSAVRVIVYLVMFLFGAFIGLIVSNSFLGALLGGVLLAGFVRLGVKARGA